MSNDAFLMNEAGKSDTMSKARGEINFSQISDRMRKRSRDNSEVDFESSISNDSNILGKHHDVYERADFLSSLSRLVSTMDAKTSKIIELIYLNDYSIKDAAEEVGLSGWAASMRLKNLSKNRMIKELFDKKMGR